jgi:hypothetical protein
MYKSADEHTTYTDQQVDDNTPTTQRRPADHLVATVCPSTLRRQADEDERTDIRLGMIHLIDIFSVEPV